MVKYMYAGDGIWNERVNREGSLVEGPGKSVYGALFTVEGLAEYYRATGHKEDLELLKVTLKAALERYDSPDYEGVFLPGGLETRGIRTQGHAMVLLRIVTQILGHTPDPELEKLAAEQVNLLINRFYNPEYGVSNEYLLHDYSRAPGFEGQMFTGHSIEVQWMLMDEALRLKDRALFDSCAVRLRRFLEISWDPVYGGMASVDFFVESGPGHERGTDYSVKTMWLQCEAMLSCLMVLEYTGAPWAKDWYERVREFTLATVGANPCGVWDQATDRKGTIVSRADYHPKRKDNFHQARYMMLDLKILDRMIADNGRLTPFPE